MSTERKSIRLRIPTDKAKDRLLEDTYTESGLEAYKEDLNDDGLVEDGEFLVDDSHGSDSVDNGESQPNDLQAASDVSASEASNIPTPEEEDSEGGSEEVLERRRKPAALRDPTFHNRGLAEIPHHVSRNSHQRAYFGPDSSEIRRFEEASRRWFGDIVLVRKSEDEDGRGGMAHFPSHTEEMRQNEATVGWDWYYDEGGRTSFQQRQKIRILTPEEGIRYLPSDGESQTVILGPYGQQQAFDIQVSYPIGVVELWDRCSSSRNNKGSSRKRQGEGGGGWMFNIGANMRCLEWAPNHNHKLQYLAIAASPVKGLEDITDQRNSTPFEPGRSQPSSIQLWAFASPHASDERALATSESPPHLKIVMAFDWGDLRTFKWCPMPHQFRPSEPHGSTPIGLLAAVFSDGFVRVFDVVSPRHREPTSQPTYIRYSSPVFAYCPPSSVCTSFTFLSATDLAVAFANGSVAIFSIYPRSVAPQFPSPDPDPPSHLPEPTAWFYQPLHSTYILSLTSGYPSFPHFLISSSLDGYIRLTDIRSPHVDTVNAIRQRLGPTLITYCEPLLSVLTADESDTLRILPLRRFFSSLSVARCPASPSALGLGLVHPIALVGCADGTVLATNPMRRFYGDSRTKTRGGRQVLRICKHEYRPASSSNHHVAATGIVGPANEHADSDGGTTARRDKGIVRFTEGFKVQKAEGAVTAAKGDEAAVFSTIHEEESAVRAVAWNPNLSCGGWAAMGFGSGLVRVTDLAV